jgi:16S rRNA (adenine1518-N6/adenine1519-N6)-dimethyltransferase
LKYYKLSIFPYFSAFNLCVKEKSLQKIAPKKSLGQNFLTDKNISRKIISLLGLEAGDTVLEIGPGTGALTTLLLENDINLIAVEIDDRAIEVLNNAFPKSQFPNFQLIKSDIREINLNEYLINEKKIKTIGNIPYYISADILFWLFNNSEIIQKSIIMVQKEVAKRVCSKSGNKDYGILSIAADLVSKPKIAFDVSPSCFYPQPKVTSSILEFEFIRNYPLNLEFKDIMKLVKAGFSVRRKTLRNALKDYMSKFPLEKNEQYIANNSELFQKRAEALSTQEFIKLYLELKAMEIK